MRERLATLLFAVVPVTLAWSCAAVAADESAGSAPEPTPLALIYREAETPWRTGCNWKQSNGIWKMIVVEGDPLSRRERPAEATPEAHCWKAKIYAFPQASAGEVHLLKAGTQTPVHFHRIDTFLYVERGLGLNTVEGMAMRSGAGDAAFHNSGAWHQNEARSSDYRQIEFQVVHVPIESETLAINKGRDVPTIPHLDVDRFPRLTSALMRNADAPLLSACAAAQDGELMFRPVASRPDGATACFDARLLVSRPSGRLFEFSVPDGMDVPMYRVDDADTLVRVVHGRIEVRGGGQTTTLGPGDFAYYGRGTPHAFKAIGRATLLSLEMVSDRPKG